jgi:hypothetical protein
MLILFLDGSSLLGLAPFSSLSSSYSSLDASSITSYSCLSSSLGGTRNFCTKGIALPKNIVVPITKVRAVVLMTVRFPLSGTSSD